MLEDICEGCQNNKQECRFKCDMYKEWSRRKRLGIKDEIKHCKFCHTQLEVHEKHIGICIDCYIKQGEEKGF